VLINPFFETAKLFWIVADGLVEFKSAPVAFLGLKSHENGARCDQPFEFLFFGIVDFGLKLFLEFPVLRFNRCTA
jgi:hypothetical protein